MPSELCPVVYVDRVSDQVRPARRRQDRIPLDHRRHAVVRERREDLSPPDDRALFRDPEPAAAEVVLLKARFPETLVARAQVVVAEGRRRKKGRAFYRPRVVVVVVGRLAAELGRSIATEPRVVEDVRAADPVGEVGAALLDREPPLRILGLEKKRPGKDAAGIDSEQGARQRSRQQGVGRQDGAIEGVVRLVQPVVDVGGNEAHAGRGGGRELALQAALFAAIGVRDGRWSHVAGGLRRPRLERLAEIRIPAGAEGPQAVPPEREAKRRLVGLVHVVRPVVDLETFVVSVVRRPLVARQSRAEGARDAVAA